MSPLLGELRAAHHANQFLNRASLAALAHTRRHRALVTEAQSAISEMLIIARQPYLALSGGKDSALCLALAAPVARSLGVPLIASWSDDELEHDSQHPYMTALCAQFGVPLMVVSARDTHAGWFRTWAQEPFWHERYPGTIDVATMDAVPAMRAFGYDGVILGLRAEESSYRRINAAMRGRVYQRATGEWTAQPLARWRVEDVWAALLDRGVPWNPVYDRLTEIGVPLERQRVGPLPLEDARTLQVGWPVLWHRLVERHGDRW